MSSAESLLVERIRAGDANAWNELIDRFEGRLLHFVEGRLHDRAGSEDVVQEAFVGLLIALPNYDARQSLESYLFAIAAHKLVDYRRRRQRRPEAAAGELMTDSSTAPAARTRRPSAVARSGERRGLEEDALASSLEKVMADWAARGQWLRIACAELLFVHGMSNREAAELLGLSQQTVANQKFEFVQRLRHAIAARQLSPDVFPELAAKDGQ